MPAAIHPALYYALAALLAVGELVILAIAVNPHVSDTYRARYITGRSNCWLTDVSGEITLGERIPTTSASGDKIGQLLRCGWLSPEPFGTWSDGEESKLRFRLAADRTDLLLDLELAPLGADQGHIQQVSVQAGDIPLASFTLDRALIVARRIPIPASLPLDDNGRLELDIAVPTAVSPRELGLNDNPRRFGIRLLSLRLWAPHPEPVYGTSAAPSAWGPRSRRRGGLTALSR